METAIGVRRLIVVAVGALGFTLAVLSVAWACTADAYITGVSNSNPVPGEVIHVTGAEFYADAPVEIRWDAHDGPVLATTTTVADEQRGETGQEGQRGTFAVNATVPADATPGRHVVYAMSPGTNRAMHPLYIPGDVPEEQGQSGDEPVNEGEPAAEAEPMTEPASQPAPQEPAAVAPQPSAAPAPEPAPEPVDSTSIEQEPVPAGVAQAVAVEPEPASTPAVLMDWRYSHGALLHTAPAPTATPDRQWRYTHGALMHAVPATPESPDTGAFADAVAASPSGGNEWAAVPQSNEAPLGMNAGLGLLAIGLPLLVGGFTVATVARRREKVPVNGK